MGTKFNRVQITEMETTGGEWPMVYGKGRRKDDLVYFMLDANFLRQPQNTHEGGFITITHDEITGSSEGFFAS